MMRLGVLVLIIVGLWAEHSRYMASSLDVQGHRGARGLRPENTLPAFAAALSIGVNTLELDVGLTRDGIVVVSHDPRLNPDITRTPDGQWLAGPGASLRSLTLSALRRYDVGRIRPGTPYAQRFPHQQPVDGTPIPTLAEVIALTERAGNRVVRFNIETKITPTEPALTADPATFTEALVAALRRAAVAGRATIQSFDWRTLRQVQAVAPEHPTVYLTSEEPGFDNVRRGEPGPSPWTAGYDVDDYGGSVPRLVKAAGGAAWSPDHRGLHAAALEEAHALGLRVVVWTVNEPAHMRRLIRLGVDGIITDYPDRLRSVMQRLGMDLPAATPVSP